MTARTPIWADVAAFVLTAVVYGVPATLLLSLLTDFSWLSLYVGTVSFGALFVSVRVIRERRQ